MGMLIKYAVQELKVEGGFLEHYEDITKGFIISKCQVLEDRKVYYSEDNFTHKYIVCFPYSRFYDFSKWVSKNNSFKYYYEERKIPLSGREEQYDLKKYLYFSTVTRLYDTYEEALKEKDLKNNVIMNSILSDTSYYGYKKLRKEFEDTLSLCNDYETFIYKNTEDLDISNTKLDFYDKKDNIIYLKLKK